MSVGVDAGGDHGVHVDHAAVFADFDRQRIGPDLGVRAGIQRTLAAIALVAVGTTFPVWASAQILLGIDTALVYPTLLAAIGDVAQPTWHIRALGVYRLWRDGDFAIGALLAGAIADAYGITTAIWAIAALTAVSGLLAAVRMYQTHPPQRATSRAQVGELTVAGAWDDGMS